MRRRLVMVMAAAALLLGLGSVACGDDEGAGGETTVQVTLREFEVVPAQDSAPAGEVTFEATNEGPNDPHELVVIRTDLAPDALPIDDQGAVDEGGEGVEAIGEIEEFDPNATESATFTLEAGNYVLICNVTEEEDGEVEAHYAQGMRTGFTVE